jgi:hypothetical protein
MPGSVLVTSVKVNRRFQWSWNARGKVKVSTCRGDGSGEVDDEGYYEKSLVDILTASLGVVSALGTHEKDG